jgi:Amt family ammonium transporter
MQKERVRPWRRGGWCLPVLLCLVMSSTGYTADEAPKADAPKAAEPAKEEAPVAPDYFSGTNPKDEKGAEKKVWPDPTGASAGAWAAPAGDGKGDAPAAKLSPQDLYDRISHNLFSINMMWVLITGFLVMFMQAGFAMVETGLCRAKNAGHTMAMNFMIYPLGCIAFFAYGFAIGWGNWFNAPVGDGWVSTLGPGTSVLNGGWGLGAVENGVYHYGLIGTKGFFLHGVDDVSVMALFFFMMVFMDTTATIPTGAMAERWAWKNFCLFGLWVALPYCLYANWVWGGGWLAQSGKNWHLGHGAVDFAGSGVVHSMGGVIALAGAILIGARIGKFDKNGKPLPMPGHHVPMVIAGTFILAFGWFGFNPGSSLAGADLRNSFTVVNTMLASVAGALATMCWLMIKGMKPDPTMLCNGMLAGLVAITAPCAFVSPWAACVIGVISGVLVVESVFFWERLGIDDPVGAISVHGVNGLWGVVSLGLLANGDYGGGWNGVAGNVTGAFYGDMGQLWAQLLSAGVVAVFGFSMAYVWFKLSDMITPLRVTREVELQGLDIPEVGVHGYPDFSINDHAGTPVLPPAMATASSAVVTGKVSTGQA